VIIKSCFVVDASYPFSVGITGRRRRRRRIYYSHKNQT